MSVITGEKRGKKLLAPEGLNTRPTADKVKEAIFDIIQFRIKGTHVLDLFAGSGQMGIEAISRGAFSCVFTDTDRRACEVVKKNLAACGFEDRAEVVCGDGLSVISHMKAKRFDVIFLDPPYSSDLMEKALSKICSLDLLSDDGIIVCEVPRGAGISGLEPPYAVVKEYFYGKTAVITAAKERPE